MRIWVPGCATGEEAYSLAILLREHMDKIATCPKVQMFASDIDEIAIGDRSAGAVSGDLVEGMTTERRSRFFAEGPDGYLVRPEIRELCTFSAHSLIRDPPFSRIDMISCRNLLIYMDTGLQDRVIPIFHYALVPAASSSWVFLKRSIVMSGCSRRWIARIAFRAQSGPSEAPSLSYRPERGSWSWPRLGGQPGPGPEPASQLASAVNHRQPADPGPLRVRLSSWSTPIGTSFTIPAISANSSNLPSARQPPACSTWPVRLWRLELRRALRRCIEAGRRDRAGAPISPVR